MKREEWDGFDIESVGLLYGLEGDESDIALGVGEHVIVQRVPTYCHSRVVLQQLELVTFRKQT